MPENSMTDLKSFFSTDEKPCSTKEMMAFWKSLSPEEKSYYKSAPLV